MWDTRESIYIFDGHHKLIKTVVDQKKSHETIKIEANYDSNSYIVFVFCFFQIHIHRSFQRDSNCRQFHRDSPSRESMWSCSTRSSGRIFTKLAPKWSSQSVEGEHQMHAVQWSNDFLTKKQKFHIVCLLYYFFRLLALLPSLSSREMLKRRRHMRMKIAN